MATVLVVDDEFGIAELIDAVLTDEGYQVLIAINGKHGLEVLGQEHVDLILLDFMMPVMDGAAMMRAMAADPALRVIPVVIMSSMLEARIAERCSGYVEFMRKPFKLEQLMDMAARLLVKDAGRAV